MTSINPLVHLVSDDEVKGQAKDLFEQIKKGTGSVPKWMRVMANCDDVLVGFFTMFKAIMDDAPVEKILKWKIACQISDLNKCEFCVSVAKQQMKSLGLSDEDILKVDKNLNEKEKAAMNYCLASTTHAYNIDPKIIEEAKKYYDDAQLVELTSVVGLFNFINRFNDSLGVLPEM